MGKGTHVIGQPMYGQLVSLLDKHEILKYSRENGGECHVKHFNAYQHLVVMLHAVIRRFDYLREIRECKVNSVRSVHRSIAMVHCALPPWRLALLEGCERSELPCLARDNKNLGRRPWSF